MWLMKQWQRKMSGRGRKHEERAVSFFGVETIEQHQPYLVRIEILKCNT